LQALTLSEMLTVLAAVALLVAAAGFFFFELLAQDKRFNTARAISNLTFICWDYSAIKLNPARTKRRIF
jgi:Tfp pilus assembly protein FimT